jgi:hypothetical protein
MVKGEKDPVYSSLRARYNRLTCPVNADAQQNLDYLRSFTISEFEEMAGTPIQYALSKENNLYGKVQLNGSDIIISITSEAKIQLIKNKVITEESIISHIKEVKQKGIFAKSKPGLYVVLTARNGHAPFWLMTYFDPTMTDFDVFDISITELLDIWEQKGIKTAMETFMQSTLGLNRKEKKKKSKHNNTNKEDIFSDLDYTMTEEDYKALDEALKSGKFKTIKILNFDESNLDDEKKNKRCDDV